MLRGQHIAAGLGAQLLLLLNYVEGVRGQVARFLSGGDAGLGLLQSELRVAHVEADALFLLLERDLALPEFEPMRLRDNGRDGVPNIGMDAVLQFLLGDVL